MPGPRHVEIMIMSARPERYCLVVHGMKVGEGTYHEVFQLGAEYHSFYEPKKSWQELANVDPDEYWVRRRRQEERCAAVRRQAVARQRAEEHRAELRRAHYAAAPAPQPVRTHQAGLKLVKGSNSPGDNPDNRG